MNVSAEGIHEREEVVYRKVETFFWGVVVADLLIANSQRTRPLRLLGHLAHHNAKPLAREVSWAFCLSERSGLAEKNSSDVVIFASVPIRSSGSFRSMVFLS